ncbi:MAG: porin [Pseudomonadota bacterium]
MQKKLLAVAIAGAFGAPALALAQSSTVQIYGTLYVEYSVVDQPRNAANTADLSKADFLQTPGSAIGFKGEEKLGGGLSAWFQCESSADPRGINGDGFCTRNSALGLKGGFGNFFIGNWDTPFKRTISPTNVGGNDTGIFGTAQLLTSQSTTVGTANRLSFKRRQQASFNYDSPNFGGFQIMGAVTASQASTGTADNATNNKPRVASIAAQYSAGPIYVSAGFERHYELAGGVLNDSKDDGWHIGAAYTWGPVRFGGQYTRQEFDTQVGLVRGEAKVSAFHVGVDWSIVGPHGLRAGYTKARDVKGQAGAVIAGGTTGAAGYRPNVGGDTGADMMQIRYVYTFSKRTEFTLGYIRLDNDSNAGYRLYGLGAAIQGGSKEDAIAAGLRHTF